jgi:hypothetical protein
MARSLALTCAVVAALTTTVSLVAAQSGGSQWLPFLLVNRLPQLPLPLSYAVDPPDYFANVPDSQKLHNYHNPHPIPDCNNLVVQPEQMENYEFQTETWLTTLGTDIYDAGVWCMAVTLLGEGKNCTEYLNKVLLANSCVQFANIRGDQACSGVEYYGQCPSNSASCGFCYGDDAQTLSSTNAYFMRMIGPYWSIEGTVDARCPQLNQTWKWNDYKPVLGENAWAQLLSPAQVAMMNAHFKPADIPATDPVFQLGIPFLTALEAMKVGNTGAFYYTPWNTWFNFSHESEIIGATFSVENQASLLGGLEALQYILTNAPSSPHASYLPQVQGYTKGLRQLLVAAWDSKKGFFRQGGTYNKTLGGIIEWVQNGQPDFAVDCQTWVGAVLGTQFIDTQFGHATAYNLWQTVKSLGGWNCPNGMFCGVGYTYANFSGQVFSGEWTYGAINWLNVMIADSGYNSTLIGNLQYDIQMMEFGLETYLWTATKINNSTQQYSSVKYSDIRYYIPFGWWANDIPATASTAWAALVMSSYNPFNINNGSYHQYPGL